MTATPSNLVSPPEQGIPRNLQDLHDLLQMYNEVTLRLQNSHERLEQEVVRLSGQLEEKNRELEMKKRLAALGEMAAGIAHEIRNPLGGIQLYASTLAAEVADRPLASELVSKIASGVRGLNALVCDMLTFTGNMPLHRSDEELAELIAAAVELAQPSLLRHSISLRTVMAPDAATANVDGKLLGRVLLNLILNAADALGDAGATDGVITIETTRTSGGISLAVTDNGPGIPADVLERIFNPFFTTKHTGTGLGLAIVHRIIEAHAGTITAQNLPAPQHGARFVIQL